LPPPPAFLHRHQPTAVITGIQQEGVRIVLPKENTTTEGSRRYCPSTPADAMPIAPAPPAEQVERPYARAMSSRRPSRAAKTEERR
jgi:hypothetical protein